MYHTKKFKMKFALSLILVSLLISMGFMLGGCEALGYGAYVLVGDQGQKSKAIYEGLENQKVLILLNTPAGMEYSFPQSRESLHLACQKILKEKVDGISFSDYDMVENFIMRELDWISMPISVLAKKFSAQRVIYIDIYEFTLQDSNSIGIYQGQTKAEVKVYESDSQTPNTPVFNYYIDFKYPENHPVAASPDAKYRVLTGTLKQIAYQTCKRFFVHKEKQE